MGWTSKPVRVIEIPEPVHEGLPVAAPITVPERSDPEPDEVPARRP
jgi:hypothetical protein